MELSSPLHPEQARNRQKRNNEFVLHRPLRARVGSSLVGEASQVSGPTQHLKRQEGEHKHWTQFGEP